MISLDDSGAVTRLDRSGMLALADSLADQCRTGWSLGMRWAEAVGPQRPSSLVVVGMGGSAIAGDLVRGVVASELEIPMVVVRDYRLPGWIGAGATVVCSSYSGETEETLQAFRNAQERKSKIIVITSGGTLGREASAMGLPTLQVPSGLPPRASLGYSLFGLLALIDRWRLMGPLADEVQESFKVLEEGSSAWSLAAAESDNQAKQLARALAFALPLVFAPEGPLGAAAFRWKTQLNENGKLAAYSCLLPELDHNEIVGWERPFAIEKPHAVFLRDSSEPDRIRLRTEVTVDILKNRGVFVSEVWTKGSGAVARMMSSVYLGDYVSIYAGLLRGFDPTPVDVISELKARLRMGSSN